MSCIIGMIENGRIILACDGVATTSDGDKRPIVVEKILRYEKPNMLIAWAGDVRPGQTLKPHYFKPPKVIYDLPDAIRDHFESKGCMTLDESGSQITKCNYLIAYEDRLFEILLDFQLNEVQGNFTSVGAGASYALGSLYTTQDLDMTTEEKITLALDSACEYSATCGPPYIFEEL